VDMTWNLALVYVGALSRKSKVGRWRRVLQAGRAFIDFKAAASLSLLSNSTTIFNFRSTPEYLQRLITYFRRHRARIWNL